MSKKNTTGRSVADTALAAVEKVRQRPEIAAAMRADGALAGKMQAAARAAADSETKRCADVVELCAKLGQPKEALAMIASGKSLADVEAILRQKATAVSWDRATTNLNDKQPSEGAPVAGWEKVIASLPSQS